MAADTYSATLGLLLMGTGNDNNTWGVNANSFVFQIIEDAIANALTNTVTGGTLDLSGSPPPAAASQVRYAALIFNGTLTSNQTVIVPNLTKFWWVKNATSGSFSLSIKTPSGSASAIPQNSGWQLVYCDGSNGIVVWPFNTVSVRMPDGTVSLPAYSNVNETASGWYRAGTQDWRFSVNGSAVLQITGAGASTPSVINVLSPNAFQVNGVSVNINWVVAGGTADAITATYSPAIASLSDGLMCFFRASAANTSTAPTFSPNGLTARTIVKSGGVALLPGDIPGNLAEVILRYNLANTRWEILNPAQRMTAPPPAGRLTPVSGTPVISSDATSVTSIFYTPYKGNTVPIYNGSVMIPQTFTEQTLALVANHLANVVYDVFAFMNGSTFTIGTGPAWATSSAGAGSRGTGAGTTQLAYQNGYLTNAVSITARNGGTTYTVAANQATYLGSIFIDSVAGQVTCHVSYGQSRKFGVWNAYNRVQIRLKAGDSTASWTYASSVIRSSRGSAANSLTTFCGLPEENYTLEFSQLTSTALSPVSSSSLSNCRSMIGYNSTAAGSGTVGTNVTSFNNPTASNFSIGQSITNFAQYLAPPVIGINTVNALEQGGSEATSVDTFFGTENYMVLSARWDG